VTPKRTITLLRILFVAYALFMGIWVGEVALGSQSKGAIYGLLAALLLVLADRLLRGFSLRVFSSATFGLLLGFAFSSLFLASDVLRYALDETRWIASLCVYSAFGYLGMMLAMRSNRDEFSLVIPYVRFRRTAVQDVPVVVDTSILIDGRLMALCHSGFLTTSLVVPRFVVEELQRLADSSEQVKRDRGRRGLDLLSEIRRRSDMNLTLHDSSADEDATVDARLIAVTQVLQARLLTNDSNLALVARLEGVSVLNVNDLARALHPSVMTGDELEVSLIKPGRETHQAVGFLPNGSMIVVNHARTHVGENVTVIIGGVLQTVSGQMYFAELKLPVARAK